MMQDKCDKCAMSTAKHCPSLNCGWRRCIRCRAFGVQGSMRDYDPAPKLEELYAMLAVKDEDRIPALPVQGND